MRVLKAFHSSYFAFFLFLGVGGGGGVDCSIKVSRGHKGRSVVILPTPPPTVGICSKETIGQTMQEPRKRQACHELQRRAECLYYRGLNNSNRSLGGFL